MTQTKLLTSWPEKYHKKLSQAYDFFMTTYVHSIQGGQIYLAYSGGVDSLVLYEYFTSRGLNIIPVYVMDTQDEEEYKALYKPDNLITCDTRPYIPLTTVNYEREFRKSRYEQISKVLPPDAILLTAHHLDDLIETYVMRTMQGKGIMSMVNPMPCVQLYGMFIVRPLLFTPKDVIQKYAHECGLPVLYDVSNEDVNLSLRNYVRAQVVPHITSRTQYGKLYKSLYAVKEEVVRCSRLVKFLLETHSTKTKEYVPPGSWFSEEAAMFDHSDRPAKYLYKTRYNLQAITRVIPLDEFLLSNIPGLSEYHRVDCLNNAKTYIRNGLTVVEKEEIICCYDK